MWHTEFQRVMLWKIFYYSIGALGTIGFELFPWVLLIIAPTKISFWKLSCRILNLCDALKRWFFDFPRSFHNDKDWTPKCLRNHVRFSICFLCSSWVKNNYKDLKLIRTFYTSRKRVIYIHKYIFIWWQFPVYDYF